MQVCLAVGELLREGERKTGLQQHVEPPAFDLRSLVLWCLGDLGHERDCFRPFLDEPCRVKVCSSAYSARNAPSRFDSAVVTAVSSLRVSSSTRASSTAR